MFAKKKSYLQGQMKIFKLNNRPSKHTRKWFNGRVWSAVAQMLEGWTGDRWVASLSLTDGEVAVLSP